MLPELGNKLRKARKSVFPKDDMYAFAVRLGVSRATLQKMEKGDLSVSLEKYYRAAQLLGVESSFDGLFDMEEDFFQ
ncbi:helix-turn-helix transcriptional regulator [Agaribacterium sp. ZY112]|uniref:helix-turn-helix transcriptional regulator n=1 Tax=Agaribacterium sp. ZY112 TaxID=3233574 RepID=UPI0035267F93